jgi:hypothetical protein
MATKPKRAPLPALTPGQLDLAHALYLRRGATPRWVASQFQPRVDWRSVEATARALRWKEEKLQLDIARERRSKLEADAQLALEVEQDECHAAQARRTLQLRELLVEGAFEAVGKMTPAEKLSALRHVDDLKDLQFVERLARGRATDKIEADAAENLRALSERMLEALTARAAEAQQTPPGAASTPPEAPPAPATTAPDGPPAAPSTPPVPPARAGRRKGG